MLGITSRAAVAQLQPPGNVRDTSPSLAETGVRKRSPSPTPHKRSSSLSRTGRDPSINAVPHSRLRSASPASRPSTQLTRGNGDVAERTHRGSDVLVDLERKSGAESSAQPSRVVAPSLAASAGGTARHLTVAGLSSRLKMAESASAKSAGLQTVGSLTVGSLGASPVDGRQAGRGIWLRVGQASTKSKAGRQVEASRCALGRPSPITKLRVGGAASGLKISPSTLTASRLFGELKEHSFITSLPSHKAPSAQASGMLVGRMSPRTAMWASEVRAASMRFDQAPLHADTQHATSSNAGTNVPKPHLPSDKDPWVALERLRQTPESAEFVYMIQYRRDRGLPLNPYHVKVVPHAKVSSAFGSAKTVYYTLSLGGVTTNRPGEAPEFTQLELWKRECYIFDSLLELDIFCRYKWWKNFKVWKENIKYQKFAKNRESFRRQSVLMNPIMYTTLLNLRDQTTELENSLLFDDKDGSLLCTLGELSDVQQTQRVQFLRSLLSFWQRSIAGVKCGCEEVLADFEQKFLAAAPKEIEFAGAHGKKSSDTSNALSAGHGGVFKYTMQAAKRLVHEQLFRFMLLCDYMVLHAIKVCVVDSTARLCHRFNLAAAAVAARMAQAASDGDGDVVGGAPILIAQLEQVFDHGDGTVPQLHVIPSEDELEMEIEGIASSFLKTVASGVRLLNHPDLTTFYALYEEGCVSEIEHVLGTMIHDSDEYKTLLGNLRQGFVSTYDKVHLLIQRYQHLSDFVVDNAAFDIQQVETDVEATDAAYDGVLALEAGFAAQVQQMRAVEEFVDCDALRVVLTGYKNQLIPSPTRCIEQIRDLLPRLLARKQRRLLDQINEANSNLAKVPDKISDYMIYCTSLELIDAGQMELEDSIMDSNKRLYLLQDHNMELSKVDSVTCTILQSELQKLQTALQLANEHREANNGTFVGVLEGMLLAFREDISAMQLLAEDSSLVYATDEVQSVLATARDLSEQMSELEEKARLIRSYQRALRRPVAPFDELADMLHAVNLKRR